MKKLGRVGNVYLGEEVAEDIDRLATRESYLLIRLMMGEVGELFFQFFGRKYRAQSSLDPYRLVIEPFDN